jgi:hypothetical protein
MTLSKRENLVALNERIVPPQIIKLDKEKLRKLLQRHFPEKATDSQWVTEVSTAIDYAHSRSRLACYHFGRPTGEDVGSQLGRVVESSNELLEALSGASARRHQTSIANRLWYPLHSFWTLLYGPPEDGDFWQKTPNRPSELDQAFQLLRKLNQRSRRILRRIERADSGKRSVRSGAKPDHYLDSFVMCLGSCPILGGAPGNMPDRLEIFITDYLVEGRKQTTRKSVRDRWDRVKGKGADPWTELDRAQNTPISSEI